MNFCQTRIGTRAHPSNVIADLGQRHRDNSQCPRGLDEAISGTLSFKVIFGFGNGQRGGLS